MAGMAGVIPKGLFWGQEAFDGVLDGEKIGGFFYDDIDGGAIAGGIAGTHDDGGAGRAELDDVRHFVAGHAGHGVVGQDDIVQDGVEAGQGFAGGIGGVDLIAEVIKEHLGQEAGVVIVVNYQDCLEAGGEFILHRGLGNWTKSRSGLRGDRSGRFGEPPEVEPAMPNQRNDHCVNGGREGVGWGWFGGQCCIC